jgi:hypothetical protein
MTKQGTAMQPIWKYPERMLPPVAAQRTSIYHNSIPSDTQDDPYQRAYSGLWSKYTVNTQFGLHVRVSVIVNNSCKQVEAVVIHACNTL